MSEVTLTIDGRTLQVEAGTTVFEAAKKAGIKIPHLCYREDLSQTAACRLCVVEVEGARNLSASCALPVSNKMVVRTDTPRVTAARRMVLEFLLSDHPTDCMTCEKGGTCSLERYAYEFGIRKSRFEGERHTYPLRDSNPFFERDYNKCILCARCVTVCHEIQYCTAVDQTRRGFANEGGRFRRRVDEGDALRLLRQLRQRLSHGGAHGEGGPLRGTLLGDEESAHHLLLLRGGVHPRPERERGQDRQGDLGQGAGHEQGVDLRQGQVRIRLRPQSRPSVRATCQGEGGAASCRVG